MIYTYDKIKNILKSPINRDRWGNDTHTVISIIKAISDSNCSSCTLRKNISKLKTILNKYGDDIVYSPYRYEINTPNGRIPCSDCVAKHVSQAFVLQGEFYQGYTEYLPLIESHIEEAIEECDKSDKDILDLLHNILKKVIVDRVPDIPIVLYKQTDANVHTILPDSVDINNINFNDIPIDTLKSLLRILSNNRIDYIDLNSLHESNNYIGFNFGGHLAQAAEFVSKFSSELASILRHRRLAVQNHFRSNKHIDIDHVFVSCDDIIDKIYKYINGVKIPKK